MQRTFMTLVLIVFINMVGFGVVLPVFPFFGSLVHASPTETTLAMAAYSLGQLVGAPVWGKISDRIGRRPVLALTLAGAALSYVMMAHAGSILTLGLSRLFAGLMAGNIAAAFAYVGDITSPEERPKAMGMIGAAFGVGFIVGPAIGGLIAGDHADLSDFVSIGYVAALVSAMAAIGAWLFLPESLTAERRRATTATKVKTSMGAVLGAKPMIWILILLSLLVIGAAALMETSLAFFAHDEFLLGPREVGFMFGGVGVVTALLQGGAAGPLARRFGSASVANAGLGFNALGLLLIGLASTMAILFAGLAAVAIGLGLYNPAFQTLVSDQTDDTDRGLVMGLTQGASSLGRVIGPAASGAIYEMHHSAPFTIGALVMALSLLLALVGFYNLRRKTASSVHIS